MSNVCEVFNKMDEEQNKLEGIVSILVALDNALLYGPDDPKEYMAAITLVSNMLDDYKDTQKELICQGFETIKAESLDI